MPPRDKGEPVPKDKAAVIARWIKEGAKLDAGIDATADLVKGTARAVAAAGAAGGVPVRGHRQRARVHPR